MKLARERMMEIQNVFTMLCGKDTVKDMPSTVAYGIGRNISRLRALNVETSDQVEKVQEQLRGLLLKHCEKDDEGKPTFAGENYKGLNFGQCPEYDTATRVIQSAHKDYMRTEVDFEEYRIKGQPPTKGTGLWAFVCEFFEEPTEAK